MSRLGNMAVGCGDNCVYFFFHSAWPGEAERERKKQ